MQFLFAILFACFAAVAMAANAPNPACSTSKYPVAYEQDTIYCIGVDIQDKDGHYYNVKGNAWLGTVKAAKPYTICCGPKP